MLVYHRGTAMDLGGRSVMVSRGMWRDVTLLMHRLKNHDCVCAEIKERPPFLRPSKCGNWRKRVVLNSWILWLLYLLHFWAHSLASWFQVSTMFNPSAMEHGQAEWDMKQAFFAKTVDGTNLKYGLNMLKSHWHGLNSLKPWSAFATQHLQQI